MTIVSQAGEQDDYRERYDAMRALLPKDVSDPIELEAVENAVIVDAAFDQMAEDWPIVEANPRGLRR